MMCLLKALMQQFILQSRNLSFPIYRMRREIDYQLEHADNFSGDLILANERSKSPYKASWIAQFRALLWRSFLSVIKEPMIMQVRFAQTIVSNRVFLPASTRSVPPGIHFALLLLLLVLLVVGGRPLIKLGNISADS
jgi:hypothetical protein